MQAGAKGVKIGIAGRLGGAEIARSEMKIMGSIPLHTLDADVDYGFAASFTTYGAIGVKVWIYRGRFDEQVEEEGGQEPSAPRQRRERRPPREDGGPSRGRRPARTRPAAAEKPPAAEAEAPAAKATTEAEPAPEADADAGNES